MNRRLLLLAGVVGALILPIGTSAQELIFLDTFEDGLGPWQATDAAAELVTDPVFDGNRAVKLTGAPPAAIQRPADFTVTDDTYITAAVKDLGEYYFAVQDTAGKWYGSRQWTGADWYSAYARLIAPRRVTHFPGLQPGTKIQAVKIYMADPSGKNPVREGYLDNIAVLEAPKAHHLHDLLPEPVDRNRVPNPVEFDMPQIEHPFLNLGGPEGLEKIRKAYAANPSTDARKYVERADACITRWEGKQLSLPFGDPRYNEGQGRCKIHVEPLTFDLDRPDWHYCAKCDKNYDGPEERNSWAIQVASHLAYDMQALAYAWAYTAQDKYAQQTVRVLEFFADTFYDEVRPISYGDYGDAMWSFPIRQFTEALDIVWDWPGWQPGRRQSLTDRALAPRAPAGLNNSTSNYMGRNAYEQYRMGMTLGRKDLVDDALNAKLGRYVHDLFNNDGIWIEKTFGYQDFVFNYFMLIARMAKQQLGIDLWHHDFGNKTMETILASYARTAMPDLRVPAIGDNRGREQGISAAAKLREAYEVYGNELFAIYKETAGPLPSMALRDTGWVVLRSDADRFADQSFVMPVFHQRFGAHGHPDCFSFVMFANGEYIIPDLDTPDYNMKGYWTYYKNPSSHNTIVVDTNLGDPEPSKRYPLPGKLVAFEDGPAKVAAIEDTGGDIRFRRLFVLSSDGKVLIDIYQADADAEHTWDWLFHAIGKRSTPLHLAATDQLGNGWRNGYKEHTDITVAQAVEPWEMLWQTEKQRVKLCMLGGPPTQLFAAKGLGWLPTETIDCVIARRRAQSTTFAAVYQALLPTDEERPIVWSHDTGALAVGDIEIKWGTFAEPLTITKGDWHVAVNPQ